MRLLGVPDENEKVQKMLTDSNAEGNVGLPRGHARKLITMVEKHSSYSLQLQLIPICLFDTEAVLP